MADLPRPVRRILPTLALLFAWLCANGALLDAMQVVAWARMFAGYSEMLPVTEALRATFDPARPCELCTGVAKAKETQQKQLPPGVERDAAKFVLAVHAVDPVGFAREPGEWREPGPASGLQRRERVPVPPPRA